MWYGTLGYTESGAIKSASTKFEQINIVHNIAALYTHLGTNQPQNDNNGTKLAYKYFQYAAGCFRYIVDELLPKLDHAPPLDLDTNTHEALYYMCLAQAQEAFWQKAVMEELRNTLISRLAMKVSDYYNDALNYANKSPSIRSEWIHHLTCKKYHFQAASQYRASVDCLDNGHYGTEVARLRESLESCSLAFMDSKYVSQDVLDDLKGLQNRVKSDLTRAESDNDLIYLQLVPAATTLSPILAISMSKPDLPEEVRNPVGYIENTKKEDLLFSYILPYAIYQAGSAFKEKIVSYVETNFVMESKNLSLQMQKVLEELGLPGSLEAVEKPEGLPGSLIDHITDLESKGGITKVRESMNDISKLSLESQHLFEEGIKMLEYEEKEDTMMRERQGTQRWNREDSRTAGRSLWKSVEEMQQFQQGAISGDEALKIEFKKVENYLETLSKGQEYVERMIPNSNSVTSDSYLEHIMQELKEILLQARGVDARRKEYCSNLLQIATHSDMLGDMIDEYNLKLKEGAYNRGGEDGAVKASDFEEIYLNQLKEFEKKKQWIEDERQEQKARISKVRELNEEFLNARENDDGTIARENAIQRLEVAHIEFSEVLRHIEEARKFYNHFIQQLQEFLEKCKQFIYTRRIEGRELEVSIAAAFEGMNIRGDENQGNENEMGGINRVNNNNDNNNNSSISGVVRQSDVSRNHVGETMRHEQQQGTRNTANHNRNHNNQNQNQNQNHNLWKPGDDIRFG